jgi:uncharacterized protein YjbI with pentapeptide repeats
MKNAIHADDIDAIYAEDESPTPTVIVELIEQKILGRRWPCVTLVGNAYGTWFFNCDLRGAELSQLRGATFERCALFGARLGTDAVLHDCMREALTMI